MSPVRTQHALGKQIIEILEGESKARNLAYYNVSYLGQGDYNGQMCRYNELLVRSIARYASDTLLPYSGIIERHKGDKIS